MRERTGECEYNGECDYRSPKLHDVSASGSNELLCDVEFLVNDIDDWLNTKYCIDAKTRSKLNVAEIERLKAIALQHYN